MPGRVMAKKITKKQIRDLFKSLNDEKAAKTKKEKQFLTFITKKYEGKSGGELGNAEDEIEQFMLRQSDEDQSGIGGDVYDSGAKKTEYFPDDQELETDEEEDLVSNEEEAESGVSGKSADEELTKEEIKSYIDKKAGDFNRSYGVGTVTEKMASAAKEEIIEDGSATTKTKIDEELKAIFELEDTELPDAQDATPVKKLQAKPQPTPTAKKTRKKRAKKLTKEAAKALIDEKKKALMEKFEDNDSSFKDQLATEFEAELGPERSGVYNSSGNIKGRKDNSSFSAEELEEKLNAAEKAAVDTVFSRAEEAEVDNTYGGNLGSLDLFSRDGKIYLRTSPPDKDRRKGNLENVTEFEIDQNSKIAKFAKEAIEQAGKEGRSATEEEVKRILRTEPLSANPLKQEIIDIVRNAYANMDELPKRTLNLSSFNVTDVSGLFPEELNITNDQRTQFKSIKRTFESQGARLNERLRDILIRLASHVSVEVNSDLLRNPRSNPTNKEAEYERVIRELEKFYGDANVNLEEVLSISEETLRRLLS